MSGKFHIYRSSAGSGKTYQLSKNYIKIILAAPKNDGEAVPDYYRHILALTFTKAAAEEMKIRILHFLKMLGELRKKPANQLGQDAQYLLGQIKADLATEYPHLSLGDEEIGKRCYFAWKRVLNNYSEFSVQTIDSFVNSLSRSFYRDLGLAFDLELSFDVKGMVEEAADLFFNDLEPGNPWVDWISDFYQFQRQNQQSWVIRRLVIDFAQDFLPKWQARQSRSLPYKELKDFAAAKSELQKRVRVLDNGLKKLAQESFDKIKNAGVDPLDLKGRSNGIGAYLEKVASEGFSQNEFKSVEKTLSGEQELLAGNAPAQLRSLVSSNQDAILESLASVQSFREKNRPQLILAKNSLQVIQSLAIFSGILDRLNSIKKEEGVVFLDDLHELIKGFVTEEPVPFIFERVGNKFWHIMVDEFQDTSSTQWINLLPLLSNGLAMGQESLIVGDPKQSIYAWRGGDPDLLVKLPGIPEQLRSPVIDQHIIPLGQSSTDHILGSNYRSAETIVEFNNSFFEFVRKTSGEKFPLTEAFYQDHNQEIKADGESQVELIGIEESNEEKFEELALAALPELIKNAVNEGFEYSEIAILVRYNHHGRSALEYLLSKAIPAISSESLQLDSNPAVRSFISLLNFITNPGDAFFRWSLIRDLSEARNIAFPDVKRIKSEINGNPESFWKLISGVFGKGADLAWIRHDSIYTILERFVRAFALDQDAVHKPFVFSLFDLVFHLSRRRNSGIRDFLDHWEENRDKLMIGIGEQSPAVRIISIHKSKGLEFPYVIVPFTDWASQKLSEFIFPEKVQSSIKGLGVYRTRKELEETAMDGDYYELQQKTFIEALNLLYVSYTRPIEKLVSVFPLTGKDPEELSFGKISHLLEGFFFEGSDKLLPTTISGYSVQRMVLGKAFKRKSRAPETLPDLDLNTEAQSQPKPWIELRMDELWRDGKEIQTRPRDFGTLVHKVMESVHDVEDFEPLSRALESDPDFDEGERARLQSAFKGISEKDELRPFFSSGARVFNEQSFLDGPGFFRPDRVIKNQSEWLILDYKTGKPDPSHAEQINLYGKLLRESLDLKSEPKKCLLYFEDDGGIRVEMIN